MTDLFDAYSIKSIIIIFIAVLITLKPSTEFLEWTFDKSKNRVKRRRDKICQENVLHR